MWFEIRNIKTGVKRAQDIEDLCAKGARWRENANKAMVAERLGVPTGKILSCEVLKRSIDARHKRDIYIVYSFAVEVDDGITAEKIKRASKDNLEMDDVRYEDFRDNRTVDRMVKQYGQGVVGGQPISTVQRKVEGRPVIIGAGPAGLFCAYILAKCGLSPIVLERGKTVEERLEDVKKYASGGELNPNSNIQFGEGGAGTFSDGKLTTRINDRRCNIVMEVFTANGAPEEIKYMAMPHVGSDNLRRIIPSIREEIIRCGGEFYFETEAIDIQFNAKSGEGSSEQCKSLSVCDIKTGEKSEIQTNCVVLAIGHSARDTFEELLNCGFTIEQKAFSVGARIEHLSNAIDEARYGDFAGMPILGKAAYQLSNRESDRTAYTFCMCPGGRVISAASELGTIVTNGMSNYNRGGVNSNSAFVVSVGPNDFGGSHPLAGVDFQRTLEKRAFSATNSGINSLSTSLSNNPISCAAPVQTLGAFCDNRCDNTSDFAKNTVQPSYTGKVATANLNSILPQTVTDSMKRALASFDRRINGFAEQTSVLTGVETRTSSPVRILRNDSFEAIGKQGVYPAGEGPGYAGGIVSAAVDGIKVAEEILRTYKK